MSSSSPPATGRIYRQVDEQQVILRLPPALASRVQLQLDDKLASGQQVLELPYQIEFIDNRHALFRYDGKTYAAVLLDLPCVVESSTLGETKKLYKNLDVHQVLQVESTPIEEAVEKTETDFCLEDGITHVTKGAKTRFRKDLPEYSAERVSYVEGLMKNVFELKYNLVKGESAKKTDALMEFLEEEEWEDATKEPTTGSLEQEESQSFQHSPEGKVNTEDSPMKMTQTEDVPVNSVFEQELSAKAFENVEAAKVSSVNVSEERIKSEPLLEAPQDNMNSPTPPQLEQQKVLEAQRKAERFKLEKSMEAQQSKIRQMEEKIRDVSNRALKQRMQQHLDDMNQELARLREALEKHDKESHM
ncbi:hypothetical protein Gasu2_38570 [Galdieria sulphuraria]|uniref:Transcription initiation factor TFIID, subunit TAF7 n=1 Tax=Galdieria sulphuraria TaxID=130081 RepID=M2Y8M0_GALSU|nr:transcription initiation factor TFIID, subunit TAF7 [Galdieria sulphuraria]EME32189.1 transcription initiation factor TFIID, subunit TAF7 [Galdieria sulphuraria]GJD09613.1 hypothetical protein Gasu2_38570 [Galdieria sulphuraria]|eukprot:XP_005708709.1 transcription initiation factor TFIID, subunit TAF7 [Galdieria sulphuraria]